MKKIMVVVFAICLLIITGCLEEGPTGGGNTGSEQPNTETNNTETNVVAVDFMEIERSVMHGNREVLSVRQLKSECLENPYGFAIKAKVTGLYENVLVTFMLPDSNNTLRDLFGIEIPVQENGYPVAEAISPGSSHMLTEVSIEEIYYTGDNIVFNIGDTIQILEHSYLHHGVSFYIIVETDEKDKLFISREDVKLEPRKEYLLFGYYKTDCGLYPSSGSYRTVGLWEGKVEIGTSFTENMPEDYFSRENREQIFSDYIENYRTYLRGIGYPEDWDPFLYDLKY